MSQRLKISVITVCYNSALTLERTIDSVIAQDWPLVEHIVIDGGSTDRTPEILDRHRQKFAYSISEPDGGIYDAMNKGLARATGDVICFLNGDDFYASGNVLSRVATVMSDSLLDAVIADVAFFNEQNPQRIVRRYRSSRFNPDRLAWGWMPAHPAMFLRKHVTERVGKFKTDYRIAGDFEFIVRAFYGHSLRYVHVPEVWVHMQSGGVSTNGWRAKVRLNTEVLRACRENGVATNMLKILSKYPAKVFEFFLK